MSRAPADSPGSDSPDPGPLAAEIRRRLGPSPELGRRPAVSIVVVNRDGAPHLRRLLAGLVERTAYPDLELILVDNASRDDSLDFMRAVEAPFPISILANYQNESFSDANNQGAERASGDLLLFMNNDARPFEAGWLSELVACHRASGAAAVVPTIVEPASGEGAPLGFAVQQRGLTVFEQDGLLVPGFGDRGADPLGEGLGEDVERLAVSAACLLVDRGAFESVGGFTHGYMYGVEDIDFALKLREAGMTAVCSGRAFAIHPPSATLGELPHRRYSAWQGGNRRLFLSRWGPRVRREYELDRLEGGGLWSESGAPAESTGDDRNSPPRPSRAEVEALGYCLKVSEPPAAPGLLEGLQAALRRRGHRCMVLEGDRVEDLRGLDYDVAVHLMGRHRYVTKPAQLNVLWSIDALEAPAATEAARYDLVVTGPEDPDATDPHGFDRFAASLAAAVDARAAEIGFRMRIGCD